MYASAICLKRGDTQLVENVLRTAMVSALTGLDLDISLGLGFVVFRRSSGYGGISFGDDKTYRWDGMHSQRDDGLNSHVQTYVTIVGWVGVCCSMRF